ncbi:sulfite exporter TauE/SafE family protein [Metabacillus halosaccharovorans]|uniref:sulfite exporter TauE/SafE family protein n=1 Tax=Metabacillus halosaccharovorans TaxID=930124 RepID=UPI000994F2D3|nr:sulfite exporter TauE/SafE family protein [Metabacillus halosaccharovorans]
MVNILIFSLIIGLVSAILIIPFTKKKPAKKENKTAQKTLSIGAISTLLALIMIGTFAFYYMSNLDRNISSLWIFMIVVSALGAMIASGKERIIKGVIFLGSLVFGIYLLSAPFFNANEKFEYADMKESVEIKAFDETKTPASVPPEFARNKMKKAFGQVPNTSYYELGHLQIQKVNGEFVYIAPVEFSGFFKWLNGDEIPGYFTLSATDSSKNPKFIKSEMTYTPSSYFNKKVERHIRMNYPKHIFYGDVQLEIDEEGKPYYLRTYGQYVSARNGFKVEGIVMVDPKNGDTKDYKLADVPSFIDGAVSPETVSLQNSYYGNYIHGFWNSIFGKSDVKLPSDEGTEANVSPIFDENGDMYYFTDFTSPKEGVDSMLGYSLTNSRTGKATYYTGNLEESYMDSQGALQIIEKKFIEKKWHGEMPVLYNFYGEASWLTPVLDSNGFLQNYFIVSAANPEISVYAATPNEALKNYKIALQKGGSSVDGTSDAEEKTVTGTVVRVYKEKTGDFTIVSFLLDNRKNFVISSENQPLAIYLQENDKVTITYLETGENFLPVKEMVIDGLE